MQLTEKQRQDLDEMEHWQFLSIQIWTHDVGNAVIALFELLVFFIAIFSMDWVENSPDWLQQFGFECKKGYDTIWWIEKSVKSGTLWELHIIIIFMYTTLAIIVLSTIPFKYDRFVKTEKEIKKEKIKAAKKHEKKLKKKGKNVDKRISLLESID